MWIFQSIGSFLFKDLVSISKEAAQGVISMQKAGIISGKDGNIFDPKGKVTLAQGASLVNSLLGFKLPSSVWSNSSLLRAKRISCLAQCSLILFIFWENSL